MAAGTELERRFVAAVCDWLVSLPHDLTLLYDAASNANLDRAVREVAVGTIIYVISPHDAVVVDRNDFASWSDVAIVLHLAANQVAERAGGEADRLKERFSEVYGELDEQLGLCEAAMGATYTWLQSKLEGVTGLTYKGKKVSDYLDDEDAGEFLYEEGLGFRTDYPVDEDQLAGRVKKASTIIDSIERRRSEEERRGA